MTTKEIQIHYESEQLDKSNTASLHFYTTFSDRILTVALFNDQRQCLFFQRFYIDTKRSAIDGFHELFSEGKEWITQQAGKCKSHHLVILEPRWSLVPKAFYQQGQAQQFLEPVITLYPEQDVFYEHELQQPESVLVSAVPKLLKNRAEFYFKKVEVVPALYHVVRNAAMIRQRIKQKQAFYLLHVHVVFQWCFFTLFEGNQLLLANQYPIAGVEDLIYYLYEMHHRLEIAQGDTFTYVTGIHEHKKRIKQVVLRQYTKAAPVQQAVYKLFQKLHNESLAKAGLHPADFLHLFTYAT